MPASTWSWSYSRVAQGLNNNWLVLAPVSFFEYKEMLLKSHSYLILEPLFNADDV